MFSIQDQPSHVFCSISRNESVFYRIRMQIKKPWFHFCSRGDISIFSSLLAFKVIERSQKEVFITKRLFIDNLSIDCVEMEWRSCRAWIENKMNSHEHGTRAILLRGKTFENENLRKIVGLSTIDDVTGDRQIDIPQVKVQQGAAAARRLAVQYPCSPFGNCTCVTY